MSKPETQRQPNHFLTFPLIPHFLGVGAVAPPVSKEERILETKRHSGSEEKKTQVGVGEGVEFGKISGGRSLSQRAKTKKNVFT